MNGTRAFWAVLGVAFTLIAAIFSLVRASQDFRDGKQDEEIKDLKLQTAAIIEIKQELRDIKHFFKIPNLPR